MNVHFLWGSDREKMGFQIEPVTIKKEKNMQILYELLVEWAVGDRLEGNSVSAA